MKRFTYGGGRNILLDGKPCIRVEREGNITPHQADVLAQVICRILNSSRAPEIKAILSGKMSIDVQKPRPRRRS